MSDRYKVYPVERVPSPPGPNDDPCAPKYADLSVATVKGSVLTTYDAQRLLNLLDGMEVDGRLFHSLVPGERGLFAVFRRPS